VRITRACATLNLNVGAVVVVIIAACNVVENCIFCIAKFFRLFSFVLYIYIYKFLHPFVVMRKRAAVST
jgi:hypothetical protein